MLEVVGSEGVVVFVTAGNVVARVSLMVTRVAQVEVEAVVALETDLFYRLFQTAQTKRVTSRYLPLHVLGQSVLGFDLDGQLVIAVDIEVFVIDAVRRKVTSLTHSVVFAVDALETRTQDRFLKAELAAVLIMSAHAIREFRNLKLRERVVTSMTENK